MDAFFIAVANRTPRQPARLPTTFRYTSHANTPLQVTAAQGLVRGQLDRDADPLTVQVETAPDLSQGTLLLNPDGSFTFTPAANFLGKATFTFHYSDGVAVSNPSTVKLKVTDTRPSRKPDGLPGTFTFTSPPNQTLQVPVDMGLVRGVTDVDGDVLTAVLLTKPSAILGTLNLSPDGSFDYTPPTNFTGRVTFTFGYSDGLLTSRPVTVKLKIMMVV